MKKLIKIISLTLVLAFSFFALAACAADSQNANGTDSSAGSDSGVDSEKNSGSGSNLDINTDASSDTTQVSDLPSNAYAILHNGAYDVRVIMPDKPTDAEKTVYTKLRASLKSKTGVDVRTETDYIQSGKTHPASEAAILVGFTNYTETEKAYDASENGEYGIKIYNKKVVFYFSTDDEGIELISSFCAAIRSNESKAFWIENNFSVKKKSVFKLESIPKYSTSTTTVDCADDTAMLLAKSTDLNTFNAYCKTLVSSGFTEYSRRDNVGGNYYCTYTKGTMALTVYFTAKTKTVRIISGPLSDIPTKNVDRTPETNKSPSVTLLTQGAEKGSGLGIIYHLPNGKFFVYDGGYSDVYTELKKLANGSPIVIAAWVISHPHPDHEEAFDKFLKSHANDIKLENVMYNYVKCSDKYGTSETIKPFISEYVKNTTNVIKPHSGQIYEFGSSSIEIIQTPEDFLPTAITDVNYSTMIVRFKVAGQTMLALGDAYDGATDILLANHGSYLKSDMVQLAHHGSWPGTVELYEKINAPIVLWPSCLSNAKTRYAASDHASLRKALSIAKDVYLAGDGTVTLTLPHTPVNNKTAFVNKIR
jgi:hypothetical protein